MKKILAIVIAICMMLNLSMVIYASSQSLDRGHKQNGIVTASTNYMSGTNQIRYQASIDSDIVVPIETFLEGEIYVNSIYKGSRTDTNQLSDTAYVNFYISQPSSAIYEIYAYGYTSYNTALGETFVYDDDWGSYNHNIIPNTYSLNEINTYANAIAKKCCGRIGI